MAGLTSFPQSVGKQFALEREQMARKQHGKPYEKLSVRDQFLINAELKKKALFETKQEQTAAQQETMMKGDQARRKAIIEQLPDAMIERMEVLGIQVPSYEPALTVAGKSMRFTQAQESAYQNLIVEEYSEWLPRLINHPNMDRLTVGQRQKLVSDAASNLKERAKMRLLKAIDAANAP
jgi:hypothetical protein